MKKVLVLLLALLFTVCLAACGTDNPSEDKSTTTGNSTQTTASTNSKTENITSTTTTKATTTTTTAKPVPVFQNPKTNFRFGKYVAKYFDNNKQSYHESSLLFYKEFEGVEYHRENFYTKEYCKKKYQDWGMEFDEQNFSGESEITVDGVTYYNIGDYEHLSEAYKMTDTEIKVTPDFEQWGTFHLGVNDRLILDVTQNNRYAKDGTVFILTEE